MTREAFIQFVNGEGNKAGLQDGGWRTLEGQSLGVGVLEQSRGAAGGAVGVHFYSYVQLTQDDSLYGPWLATQLLTVFGEDCEVQVPRHRKEKNMVQEGYAAEVLLPKVRFDDSTENDDRIRSFGRRFAKFLSSFFGNNTDAVNARNKYFNEHREFVAKYAERRRDPEQRWGLSKEELVAHSLIDGNASQITATVTTERAMSPLTDAIQTLLKANLNVILTGAPGTGKTYAAKQVAKAFVDESLQGITTEEGLCRLFCDESKTTGDESEDTSGKIGDAFAKMFPEMGIDNISGLADLKEKVFTASVQFHPGYDYSDFVVGLKPVLVDENGKEVIPDGKGRIPEGIITKPTFRWKDGVFKRFAERAKMLYDKASDKDKAPKFVFLIDEINRADLSRVFGELFSLLEEEYRYPNDKGSGVTLPNGESFVLPKNLYIIGTMNDIDRSVESMDFALRRRFAWYEVKPDPEKPDVIIENKVKEGKIAEADGKKLNAAMRALNLMIAPPQKTEEGKEPDKAAMIDLRLGSEYQLGGAIFAKLEKYHGDDRFQNLWNNHIENILSEYLRGRSNRDKLLLELEEKYNEVTKALQPTDENEKAEVSTPEPQKQKKDDTTLVIRIGDNTFGSPKEYASKTLTKFIQFVVEKYGVDRILTLSSAKQIVKDKKPSRTSHPLGDGKHFVVTHSDTITKKTSIKKIAQELGIDPPPQVDVVPLTLK